MSAEGLPSEFDVIILGTGLVESVVAAACSRVGQRVLHLDRRSYYAANWASFTFNSLLTWIEQQQEESQCEKVQDYSSVLDEEEELIYLSNSDCNSISNLQVFCFTSKEDEEEVTSPQNTTEEETEAGQERASGVVIDTKTERKEEAADVKEEEQKQADDIEEEGLNTIKPQPHVSPGPKKKISYAQLVKEGRKFNIDLVSKLVFSRGSLVDLLIKSNVSRYAEFKNITRILTYRHGNVQKVPCSRADVFASRQLSVVEKRKLMRFLTSCMEETDEQQAYRGRPYMDFLRDQQLGDNLQHFLLHSIAMVTEDTPTEVGLTSTRHFLRCLGHYGNTPFLFPVYGLGEIPQCFCRMSAVFGGIYCLRHSLHAVIVAKETLRCIAVIDSQGQRISCSHLVVEESYVSAERKNVATPTRCMSRAVLITDSSVLPSDSEQQVSMVTVPPEAGRSAVKVVELCPSTMTCLPGSYLVHLTCQSTGSAYQDLSPLVTKMFHTPESHDQGGRPSVLWCMYFNMVDGAVEVKGHNLPPNMYMCCGPDAELGHQHAVSQAERIFHQILPQEDFCPPAPNPEDILYDGAASEGASPQTEGTEPSPQTEAVEPSPQTEAVGQNRQTEEAEPRLGPT